jgi:hypothetical protein
MCKKLKVLPAIIHEQDEDITYGLHIRHKGNKVKISYKAVSFSNSKKRLKRLGLYLLFSVKGETLISASNEMLDLVHSITVNEKD